MKRTLPAIVISAFCLIFAAAYFLSSTASAASSDFPFYTDQLGSGIVNWSWNSTVNLQDTSAVNSGSNDIALTPLSWGALYLHTDTALSAADYDSVQFAIKATQQGQKFAVALYDDNNQQIQSPTPISNFGGDVTIGSYKQYTIPVSSLNPSSKPIKGIAIQEISGQNQPTLYIDDIILKAKQTQPSPTPTTTPQTISTITPVPATNTTTTQTKPIVIYSDSLATGFVNWSWGSTQKDVYYPVKSGTKSIAFSVTSAWGGLFLHANTPVDTSTVSNLTFAIKASQPNEKFTVVLRDENNANLSNPIALANVGGDPITTSWETYTIPLTTLNAQNKKVGGFIIQDALGKTQSTIYIDSIGFVGGPTSTTPNATLISNPTPTSSMPNPTPTSTPVKQPQVSTGNPFSGVSLYVDPNNNAKKTADQWRSSGRTADANQMMKIANSATAVWAVGGDPTSLVTDYTNRTSAAGSIAVIVAYNIPGRDCGQYSSGGSTYEGYKTWINQMNSAIGSKKAAVILEPDALGLDCLQNDNTYSLLRYAVDTLAKPNIAVYIEASTWVSADTMANRLNNVDIQKAQGFAINVSGFNTTSDMTNYGNTVSSKVGGKHFIIDTSRNGNGPYDPSQTDPWCNPPDRALGPKPTSSTGNSNVDAYLWIKVPGESDGTCRGGPSAGTWWPDYALGLAQKAAY